MKCMYLWLWGIYFRREELAHGSSETVTDDQQPTTRFFSCQSADVRYEGHESHCGGVLVWMGDS